MRKGPKTHHVVPNPQGGWDVKRGGASRAISRNQSTELRIHNRDGRIVGSDSHGNDPFPPEG